MTEEVIPTNDDLPEENWNDDEPYDEDGFFEPCDDCDGHDACRDFGCAIKMGLGHLVKTPL